MSSFRNIIPGLSVEARVGVGRERENTEPVRSVADVRPAAPRYVGGRRDATFVCACTCSGTGHCQCAAVAGPRTCRRARAEIWEQALHPCEACRSYSPCASLCTLYMLSLVLRRCN